MSKTTRGLVFLLLISMGVLIGSNFISEWTHDFQRTEEELERQIETTQREEMRNILNSISDSIVYEIESKNISVDDGEEINELISQFIFPLAHRNVGQMSLIRISPDEKVLFDSSSMTIKTDIEERTLEDEILSRTLIENILEEKRDSKTLSELKEESYATFSLIETYTEYDDVFEVENVIHGIRKGKPTTPNDKYEWTFKNGKTEILEWVIIPPGELGLDNRPDSRWGVNVENHRWVLLMRYDKSRIDRTINHIKEDNRIRLAITKMLYVILVFILIASISITLYYIDLNKCG